MPSTNIYYKATKVGANSTYNMCENASTPKIYGMTKEEDCPEEHIPLADSRDLKLQKNAPIPAQTFMACA